MCTLIVLHRCVAGRPLVVAANRDEFFDRPAEGFAIRQLPGSGCGSGESRSRRQDLRRGPQAPVLAPLDLEAGGTWVGLSQRGVFAGLTNLAPRSQQVGQLESLYGEDPAELDDPVPRTRDAARSRGEIVMDALAARSAGEAIERLRHLEEVAYNPFQLLVADGIQAWLVVYRDRPRVFELEPGAHIVGNVEDERLSASRGAHSGGAGTPSEAVEPRRAKLTRIRERVEKLLMEPSHELFEGLARICREHVEARADAEPTGPRQTNPGPDHRPAEKIEQKQKEQKEKAREATSEVAGESGVAAPRISPFESTCVHLADRYGTRSSLVLELSEHPTRPSRLWTTDGPPCARPFENRSSLLHELGLVPRFAERDLT